MIQQHFVSHIQTLHKARLFSVWPNEVWWELENNHFFEQGAKKSKSKIQQSRNFCPNCRSILFVCLFVCWRKSVQHLRENSGWNVSVLARHFRLGYSTDTSIWHLIKLWASTNLSPMLNTGSPLVLSTQNLLKPELSPQMLKHEHLRQRPLRVNYQATKQLSHQLKK